ncbi:MAG: polysaccharide biosynthesis/export family protein [Terriglobales bacterium]
MPDFRRYYRPSVLVLCATGLLAAQQVGAPPPARLAAGDQIQVHVFQTPELDTTAQIGPNGEVVMAAAGPVRLAGLNLAQAQQAIAARLKASRYLLAPQVSVLVLRYAGQPVTVLGAVKSPGLYWVRHNWSLLDILARAGGVDNGAGEAVLVRQPAAPGRAAATLAVDLNGPDAEAAAVVYVRPNAVVQVLAPGRLYVGGAVKRPGGFAFPAYGLTLLEAVSMAGGTEFGAAGARTWIVRTGANGRRTRRIVNLGQIRSGRAHDPRLQPFDLVYVPTDTGKIALMRGLETAVATGAAIVTGIIVFRR